MATITHLSKHSKRLAKSLKEQKISLDETVLSFDVSALFISIPVPVVLGVINRKFTEHINQRGTKNFLENTSFMPKVICLLEFVINSCVSFQGKFYQQFQGATVGSPISPVIANIYMEYLGRTSLSPEFPIPNPFVEKIWITLLA